MPDALSTQRSFTRNLLAWFDSTVGYQNRKAPGSPFVRDRRFGADGRHVQFNLMGNNVFEAQVDIQMIATSLSNNETADAGYAMLLEKIVLEEQN